MVVTADSKKTSLIPAGSVEPTESFLSILISTCKSLFFNKMLSGLDSSPLKPTNAELFFREVFD